MRFTLTCDFIDADDHCYHAGETLEWPDDSKTPPPVTIIPHDAVAAAAVDKAKAMKRAAAAARVLAEKKALEAQLEPEAPTSVVPFKAPKREAPVDDRMTIREAATGEKAPAKRTADRSVFSR